MLLIILIRQFIHNIRQYLYCSLAIDKALSKKCKTSHVGMHLHQKKTLSPKPTKQATNYARRKTTDYPHITARCIYRVFTCLQLYSSQLPSYLATSASQHSCGRILYRLGGLANIDDQVPEVITSRDSVRDPEDCS